MIYNYNAMRPTASSTRLNNHDFDATRYDELNMMHTLLNELLNWLLSSISTQFPTSHITSHLVYFHSTRGRTYHDASRVNNTSSFNNSDHTTTQ
jgi:hypothetical protein